MITKYLWDCPRCSKAEEPRLQTVFEFIHPELDFETQTTVYSCKYCNWAYKRVYDYKTRITTDYEISFDEKGNVILKQVQEY
jgi:hypothetical protein